MEKDLFVLTCRKCGHEFGLSDGELFEAQSLSCPACKVEMGSWQFYEMKAAYFKTVTMERKICSKLGLPVDEEQKFSFRVAGDPTLPEDVRLLKYLSDIYEEERDGG